ncbi:MAG: hypothetical protein KME26_28720 [Oscillatoria princeps RMCB-10]|nr:hypothetical protein [Oscillatoria princeps RMCB-10]
MRGVCRWHSLASGQAERSADRYNLATAGTDVELLVSGIQTIESGEIDDTPALLSGRDRHPDRLASRVRARAIKQQFWLL